MNFATSLRPLALSVLVLLPSFASFAASVHDFLGQPDDWFRSVEAARVAENVLSWQVAAGDWPKNTDTTVSFTGDRTKLQGTFDNSATTDELRFLARLMGALA